jgi:hypothetical protein
MQGWCLAFIPFEKRVVGPNGEIVLCFPWFSPRGIRASASVSPGVVFLPKPWQPFNVLVVAEEALAYAQGNRS